MRVTAIMTVALLLHTFLPECMAQNRSEAGSAAAGRAGSSDVFPDASAGILLKQAHSELGHSHRFDRIFLTAELPEGWSMDKSRITDPTGMFRLMLRDRHIVVGRDSMGHRDYFQLPVFAQIYLKTGVTSGEQRRASLKDWLETRVLPSIVRYEDERRHLRWNKTRYKELFLSDGDKAGIYVLSGTLRMTAQSPRLVIVVGTFRSVGNDLVYYGTGVARSISQIRYRYSHAAQILASFGDYAKKLMAMAVLTKVNPGPRERSLERFLWRHRHFYSSTSSSSHMGTGKYSNSARTAAYLDVRFLPGGRCTMKSNYSSIASSVRWNTGTGDAIGAGYRLKSASGINRGSSVMKVPCEVRRGIEGKHWLVLYYPISAGGTVFLEVERNRRVRCGRRIIRGLALAGHVEGTFSRFGVTCVYSP